MQVLSNQAYHEKNRMRLLYNLTERVVKMFTKHYGKFVVTAEGAILLSGDINRYNELFLQVESEEIIRQYESFKMLVNIYLINSELLETYIRDNLLQTTDKATICNYLQHRGDFKQAKLEELIHSLF